MQIPDYNDNSIVNLMSSILAHFEVDSPYPNLKILSPNELANDETIVLMIIDGLGYNFLRKYGRESFLFKNLKGKINTVFPTTTSAAMTTFYSGLAPQNHGVPAWFTYLRELGMVSVIMPFGMRGFNFHLGKNNIHFSDICSFKKFFAHLKYDYFSIIPKEFKGSAYSNYILEGSSQIGYENFDDLLKKILSTVSRTSGTKKKYISAYWSKFDTISHECGIQSQGAINHFRELDKKIANFSLKLKEKNSKIRLLVTADHGLIDTSPEHTIWLKDHPKLYETLTMPVCGETRAPFFYVRPSKVADFENYIKTHLNHAGELIKGEILINQNYYGLFEPNKQLFNRTGDYILLMKDNYILRDQLIGETRHELIGNHGGLSDDELYVPLIII
ncbi:alkaline phosphatase family protein [Promethearchaeum syntrophicum]|uniref:glycerophosphocholine cholinephosphodiesterase n=1 Tax=Promethearchaeum syntrophicum TaxID=2594042 RepID=A0A5B9D6B6_9ARCH|nr:alkaline phosphatase family protein [Candidatus Prometheoarchaeum syntrophicum]QEE14380.1 Type I phosphodiesterase / nucleotide pyrophosphatase [Candidatus Prometheoarchaeum syntrophicum]